ncbi:MAG: fasciclin protein, partial [Segetibacter sp.]|nr:fasciclin protein [Segetibacter sp.]
EKGPSAPPAEAKKGIVISESKELSTFSSAVKLAEMKQLFTADPYTFLAPNNAAFKKLGNALLQTLMSSANREALVSLLGFHIVPGNINSSFIRETIAKNGGSYSIKTLQGGELKFFLKGKDLFVSDEKGGKSKVIAQDLKGNNNGTLHIIDTVLMPSG